MNAETNPQKKDSGNREKKLDLSAEDEAQISIQKELKKLRKEKEELINTHATKRAREDIDHKIAMLENGEISTYVDERLSETEGSIMAKREHKKWKELYGEVHKKYEFVLSKDELNNYFSTTIFDAMKEANIAWYSIGSEAIEGGMVVTVESPRRREVKTKILCGPNGLWKIGNEWNIDQEAPDKRILETLDGVVEKVNEKIKEKIKEKDEEVKNLSVQNFVLGPTGLKITYERVGGDKKSTNEKMVELPGKEVSEKFSSVVNGLRHEITQTYSNNTEVEFNGPDLKINFDDPRDYLNRVKLTLKRGQGGLWVFGQYESNDEMINNLEIKSGQKLKSTIKILIDRVNEAMVRMVKDSLGVTYYIKPKDFEVSDYQTIRIFCDEPKTEEEEREKKRNQAIEKSRNALRADQKNEQGRVAYEYLERQKKEIPTEDLEKIRKIRKEVRRELSKIGPQQKDILGMFYSLTDDILYENFSYEEVKEKWAECLRILALHYQRSLSDLRNRGLKTNPKIPRRVKIDQKKSKGYEERRDLLLNDQTETENLGFESEGTEKAPMLNSWWERNKKTVALALSIFSAVFFSGDKFDTSQNAEAEKPPTIEQTAQNINQREGEAELAHYKNDSVVSLANMSTLEEISAEEESAPDTEGGSGPGETLELILGQDGTPKTLEHTLLSLVLKQMKDEDMTITDAGKISKQAGSIALNVVGNLKNTINKESGVISFDAKTGKVSIVDLSSFKEQVSELIQKGKASYDAGKLVHIITKYLHKISDSTWAKLGGFEKP